MYKALPAEEDLYRTLVDLGMRSGAKMLVAKVNAIVFMEPGPLSLEEIAEKTGYSLASVSNAVKRLEEIKKLRRIKEPGSKRVYVQGEKNFIDMLHGQLKHVIDIAITPMREQLPITIQELKKGTRANKDHEEKRLLKEKIDWYNDYLRQTEELLKILTIIDHEFNKTKKDYRQTP